jgi:NADH-quinone oxidoreductase subunit G
VGAAVAAARGVAAPVAGTATAQAQAVAASLLGGERRAVLLGNAAAQHPQASALLALAQWIAEHTGASCGYLGEAANSVGAQLVAAVPGAGGLNAGQMLTQPMKALLLLHTEPLLDSADAAATRAAMAGSGLIVALTPFMDAAADVADVMLPIAPFTETAGTFVNAEGRVQSFQGVVAPLGETRPGWKVLRVLGNLLGLPGFDFETADAVCAEALGGLAMLPQRLDNGSVFAPGAVVSGAAMALQRVADVPIYATDAIVRRAPSLQLTADARAPVVGLPPALWQQLGLQRGGQVRVGQGGATVILPAREDATLAAGVVRIAAGHPDTAALGAMFGPITVEKV